MDRRIRVIKRYESEVQNSVAMKNGSTILIIRRNEGIYKEWFWCRTDDGTEAFVPEGILEVEGSTATFLKDYESKELTVFEGDVLISIFEMGGWTWARKSSGEEGWIPDEITEPYDLI